MANTITWGRRREIAGVWNNQHFVEWAFIKTEARKQGYSGTPGIKEYLQQMYNAKPIIGTLGDINGVQFKTISDRDRFVKQLVPFKLTFVSEI